MTVDHGTFAGLHPVTLSAAGGADVVVTAAFDDNASGAIDPGDTPTQAVNVHLLPTVTVAATDPDAREAGPKSGYFTVTRTGTSGPLAVALRLTGSTAAWHADFELRGAAQPPAGELTCVIPDGSSSVSVWVDPVDNHVVEGTLAVDLAAQPTVQGQPAPTYRPGAASFGTVYIADGDGTNGGTDGGPAGGTDGPPADPTDHALFLSAAPHDVFTGDFTTLTARLLDGSDAVVTFEEDGRPYQAVQSVGGVATATFSLATPGVFAFDAAASGYATSGPRFVTVHGDGSLVVADKTYNASRWDDNDDDNSPDPNSPLAVGPLTAGANADGLGKIKVSVADTDPNAVYDWAVFGRGTSVNPAYGGTFSAALGMLPT